MAAADASAPAAKHDHLVEDRRRLSRSLLWRLQRAYYAARGAEAWTTGKVPWFVSANAALARAYAQVIDGYLRDVAAGAYGPEHADPARPVYLVELGAGHGRFAFLLLEHLTALESMRAGLGPRAPLRYVLTDLAEANLAFCAAHPRLRPHVEAGRIDLARFDAERDTELHLRRSGDVLSAETRPAAVVAIANYLFDSLVQDIFRVTGGALEESLAALYSTQPEPDLDDPAMIERVKLVYEAAPAGDAPYGDPALDGILADYRRTMTDTAITFPIGPLTCVRNLHRLAGGRLLLLTADKGQVHEEELARRHEPQPVVHGSFSMSVNFHAIGAWFRRSGGDVLDVTPRDGTLTPNGFVGGATAATVVRTRAAFADGIEAFGPMDMLELADDIYKLDKPSLGALLATLRMTDWDPWVFYRVVDRMLPLLDDAGAAHRREARRALTRVWARYYHLGGTRDVPFELARVWQRLKHHAEAIELYRASIELFGDSHVTHYNLGLCLHYGSHDHRGALAEFERALALQPDYAHARDWRLRMLGELRGEPATAPAG
ncbi:MAG TPA: tetratricopeptide repeat protein [Kofleriaceae bacterium]|nr:tetratricopeptide repeat protein [Kofleriaceae bacterium]